MRVLLDENVDRRLARLFVSGTEATTVGRRGWDGKDNGELLEAAQEEFDVFVTMDRGIPYQQNIALYDLAVVLLEARSNRFGDVAPLADELNEALREARPGEAVRVTGQRRSPSEQ